MAQKRKSLKKSFRKNNRSTRRKSKTNKRKSRKIRGGGEGTKLLEKVGQIEGQLNNLYRRPNDSDIKKEIRRLVDEIINHNSSCRWDDCKDKTAQAYAKLLEKLERKTINNDGKEENLFLYNKIYDSEEKLNNIKRQIKDKIN